jgi:hypothetical protein
MIGAGCESACNLQALDLRSPASGIGADARIIGAGVSLCCCMYILISNVSCFVLCTYASRQVWIVEWRWVVVQLQRAHYCITMYGGHVHRSFPIL